MKKKKTAVVTCIVMAILTVVMALQFLYTDVLASQTPVEQPEKKILFGHTYVLDSTTSKGAGIYKSAEENVEEGDRFHKYIVKALEESGVNCYMDDEEKAEAINDYLCSHLTYDHEAAADPQSYREDWTPFTDYCLLTNKAVCAGFADAFQSMCITAGIECWYVTGYVLQDDGSECFHAWNCILVDGEKKYIDPCLNASSKNGYMLSSAGFEGHRTKEELHTYVLSSQNTPVPEGFSAFL